VVAQESSVHGHASERGSRWHRGVWALSELDDQHLLALYRDSPEPMNLLALAGDPVGVGVGLRAGAGSFLDRYLRRRCASSRFPWRGKSLRTRREGQVWGFNRLASGGLVGAFRFDVAMGMSHVDGRRTITFDYDVDANPRLVRRMHDEIREVGHGVFLGIARIRGRRSSHDLAWFALDVNDQRGGIEV
jgi:hypothetical protein